MNSDICEYYKNKSILITGATGFVGKVLMEKLLRSCRELKAIYILIRGKRNKNIEHRLNEILDSKLFEILNTTCDGYRQKIIPIEGDLMEPNMGISERDQNELIKNVNIIFHSAATVRFDEPLKVAIEMNVIAVKKMINLALKMKNLESFVHVSTAYSNCDRQHISEIVYNPPLNPELLIESVGWMEDDLVKLITPKILKSRPNTYTLTKAIAENLIAESEDQIPVVIVRPSIVTCTRAEPFPGWIDNFNTATGIIIAGGKGFLRIMLGNPTAVADIIPVDTLVNMMITVAWHKATKSSCKKTEVYNFTSGKANRLTWGDLVNFAYLSVIKTPFEKPIFHPNFCFTSSKILKTIVVFVEQTIPAYILDFLLKLFKKKTIFKRLQSKLKKGVEVLEYFTTNEWEFENDNCQKLIDEMSSTDKNLFNFDLRFLNWPEYFDDYCLGIKKHVLKEDLKKVNRCKITLKTVKWFHLVLNTIILFSLLKLFIFPKYSIKIIFKFIFLIALKLAKYIRSLFFY